MKYFETLPKVVVSGNFTSKILTNIMARASIVPTLLTDPLNFYTYDIQDGDTPEIVAQKYYGDSYAYWVVLYTNGIMDPQWDWPLSVNEFNEYINSKYPNINDAYTEIHHYEKIITQVDAESNTTTTNKIIIDQTDYNNLVESTNTYSLPTGNVYVTITKNAVSQYDYEVNLNESKRNIKLLNKLYLNQLESEFEKLMS